jgi:hypothetical protein
VIVYAVVDDAPSPDVPPGGLPRVSLSAGGTKRFVEEMQGDDPELARSLRIEERELDAGGLN